MDIFSDKPFRMTYLQAVSIRKLLIPDTLQPGNGGTPPAIAERRSQTVLLFSGSPVSSMLFRLDRIDGQPFDTA